MQKPLVSVITITRNNQDELQKTVRSVMEQDYEKIEFIVVDGASTDGTPDFLASLSLKNFRWISEPDRGISDAFNKGLGMASGDTVIFMNSGDTFANARTLSRATELIPVDTKIQESVVYGDYYHLVDSEYYFALTNHNDMYANCNICHQAALIGSEICRKFKYDERITVGMDYDYWLRLLSAGVLFIKINLAMAKYDVSGITGSSKLRVHVTLLFYFLVALNTRRKLALKDALLISLLALKAYLLISVRNLIGKPAIRFMKKLLIRLGLKKGPIKESEINAA